MTAGGLTPVNNLEMGLVQFMYGYNDLGGTFSDSDKDETFNAYTINKLHERITTLEQASPAESYFEYDETHDALRCAKPIYSDSWITAGGLHDASGSVDDGSIHTVYKWEDLGDYIPDDSSSCFNAYTTKKLYEMIQQGGSADITYEAVVEALGYEPYDKETNWADDTSAFITQIKTINNQSLKGTGNITIDASVNYAAIVAALGYVPYNGTTNPNRFLVNDDDVIRVLGYTPYNKSANWATDTSTFITQVKTINNQSIVGSGNIDISTVITEDDVLDALGYTPYDKRKYWNQDTSVFVKYQYMRTINHVPLTGSSVDISATELVTYNDILEILGYTPYNKAANWTNDTSVFLKTRTDIVSKIGYEPYDKDSNWTNDTSIFVKKGEESSVVDLRYKTQAELITIYNTMRVDESNITYAFTDTATYYRYIFDTVYNNLGYKCFTSTYYDTAEGKTKNFVLQLGANGLFNTYKTDVATQPTAGYTVWIGSEEDYELVQVKDPSTLYFIK